MLCFRNKILVSVPVHYFGVFLSQTHLQIFQEFENVLRKSNVFQNPIYHLVTRSMLLHDRICETSLVNYTAELTGHDSEETAYTLLTIHCYDVAKVNLFAACVVISPDSDAFLLLIDHYTKLPQFVYFLTGCEVLMCHISIGGCYK